MPRLEGVRVLVTGGTRGIGAGIAEVLVAEGATVVLSGRDMSAGQLVADRLGPSAMFLAADLNSPFGPADLVSASVDALGGLDVLCHCAGIYPEALLGTLTDKIWHEVLDTNLTSAMALVRAAIAPLRAGSSGRVILISSISGPRTGIAGLTAYCASKAGLEGFARASAVELAKFGITVNCVAPGTILTDGLQGLYSDPTALHEVASRIPVGRIGQPSDIGNTVAFLAGSGSAFITGQSIVVDGGQTLPEVQG